MPASTDKAFAASGAWVKLRFLSEIVKWPANRTTRFWVWMVLKLSFALACCGHALGAEAGAGAPFPKPLQSYASPVGGSLSEVLVSRIREEPFNAIATAIFFLAILHTFAASQFTRLSHRMEAAHRAKLKSQPAKGHRGKEAVSFGAQIFHFLGEIEAVFGIWAVPLLVAIAASKSWSAAEYYFDHSLNFTEPVFVVVIMTMAASRPVLLAAEKVLAAAARLGRGSISAWWFSILTIGPLLGSLVTEPAAMTISALLLATKFFAREPGVSLRYATLGLLFVNVSVGGTLTHFAAPPVLMVAGKWRWDLLHMLQEFGWKAALGILIANAGCCLVFRKEFKRLAAVPSQDVAAPGEPPVPVWITAVHLLFLLWTVLNNHSPALFVGGFLFYLAFAKATEHHQDEVALRPALLVGFFLAGLVVHGGLQGWWIAPVLSRLTEVPLFFGAVFLTAFNDNAAITYLASLVPGFGPELKYAVVAGAVVGGGLTVIANAPNPAGQSILGQFFPDGISAVRLFLGALGPTVIMAAVFLWL